MLHLSNDNLYIVREILQKYVPQRMVYAFGSRVTSRHVKSHSDLDLCIMGQPPLSLIDYAVLHEAFSESNLPIRVDIVDWESSTPEFQQIIQAQPIQRII